MLEREMGFKISQGFPNHSATLFFFLSKSLISECDTGIEGTLF